MKTLQNKAISGNLGGLGSAVTLKPSPDCNTNSHEGSQPLNLHIASAFIAQGLGAL